METEKTLKQVSRVNFYIKDFCGIKFIGDEREREETRKSLEKFADKFLFDSICCGGPKGYSMTFSRNTEYIPRIGELIELDTSSSNGLVEYLTILFGENPRILEIFPKLKGEIKDTYKSIQNKNLMYFLKE